MEYPYDSGGKHQDDKKFKENYDKVFNNTWPCPECDNTRTQGHKLDCSKHWRNANDSK